MNLRKWLLGYGAATALLLTATLSLVWLARGRPGTGWPDTPGGRLDAERRREGELDRRLGEALRHEEMRRAIARDVADGHTSLSEAAARFRRIDESNPGYNWEHFRRIYPGRSDDERHCRHVIAYVRTALPEQPGEAATAAARLEAELNARLGSDGALRPVGRSD